MRGRGGGGDAETWWKCGGEGEVCAGWGGAVSVLFAFVGGGVVVCAGGRSEGWLCGCVSGVRVGGITVGYSEFWLQWVGL